MSYDVPIVYSGQRVCRQLFIYNNLLISLLFLSLFLPLFPTDDRLLGQLTEQHAEPGFDAHRELQQEERLPTAQSIVQSVKWGHNE